MNARRILTRKPISTVLESLMWHDAVRGFVLSQVEKALRKEAEECTPDKCLRQVQIDRLDCAIALLRGLDRIMRRGLVSKRFMSTILEAFLGNVFMNEELTVAAGKLGFEPPSFITISPTGRCNLKCKGCYASDAALQGNQLSFEVFDRICREKREMWGSHFTVISGGEPFLWEDNGRDLIDLAARHPSDVFMVYTNGTVIDNELARRLADVANISPCFSVEGFEADTDARRGKGVHAKVMAAMERLRNYGIPFGISATATRDNWDIITSDEFVDFYYFDQGALYCWVFQYMPIGRDQSVDLVVPPEHRVEMVDRMWRLVRERQVFMVDFWNSGTASLGCIAAGRGTGYFYINWDGDVMPCVFTPYAADNINEIYARGENIQSVLNLPLFKKIREWQHEHGYEKPPVETKNWLCPCAIRDHFDTFAEAVRECNARPITPEAKAALEDQEYYSRMVEYGIRMHELLEEKWEREYLNKQPQTIRDSESQCDVVKAGL
ncbi:MAG: radical SAM protein [Armatimonadetes bacterium]|nr:radical SAM protein [Armatimonadota bacterium]